MVCDAGIPTICGEILLMMATTPCIDGGTARSGDSTVCSRTSVPTQAGFFPFAKPYI